MKRFYPATIFGIAFGFLEAIVVVYLRKIYYPDGFSFPLTILEPQMIQIEIIREFATIIMLATSGWILGKSFAERFSFFIFTFAVWDIFYYVALKLFLNWPMSLLTWDVLFLIPITWIGPVIAPIICSAGMIIISLIHIFLLENNYKVRFNKYHLILIFAGVIIIIYTFIQDYLDLFNKHNFWKDIARISERKEFWNVIQNYIPVEFNWGMFFVGCLLIGLSYGSAFRRAIFSSK